ncbi:MAG: hypothetical protein PUE65_00830 [Mollicutes bacterium]|nr:hypothetical protein [Mollicutes bacterium]
MAKLTRKSYQRKAMVVGATAFAGIALMATGFAAWVISSSATKNVQGGVQVGTISNKSIEITDVDFVEPGTFAEGESARKYFSFEPTKGDNTGRVRCDGKNWENLSLKVTGKYSPADYVNSFSIALRMGTVDEAKNEFKADTAAEGRLAAAQTDNYITLPTCWAGGTTDGKGVTVNTNAAGIVGEANGMAITVAEEDGKKVATFTYTISFAWGSHFNNLNPSEYYDTDEGKNAHKGDAYKTDLGNFYKAMTGEDYNPKVEPTESYKKMNFAIIINADTSGTAGA